MSLLKYILIGTAAFYGYKKLTKKRAEDGRSLADDIKDQVPKVVDQVKEYGEQIKRDFTQTVDLY